MGIEIERKFLVTSGDWRSGSPVRVVQGYLNLDPVRTTRVRVTGTEAFLTIKGKSTGIAQAEFEYEIPRADAGSLLGLCVGDLIEKDRHVVDFDGLVWEIDEFLGANAGLVVAEVELESEDQTISFPGWIGEEVTTDFRYKNSALVNQPFSTW